MGRIRNALERPGHEDGSSRRVPARSGRGGAALGLALGCVTALLMPACTQDAAEPAALTTSTTTSAREPTGQPPQLAPVDAAEAGWDVAALERTLEFADEQRSTGLLIIQHGRIVAERHWPLSEQEALDSQRFVELLLVGTTPDGQPIEDVASVQKSVTSALVGISVGRGEIDPDRAVSDYLGAGWTAADPAQEEAITVRHLLSMSSGLTERLTYEEPSGRSFRYNTAAYAKLIDVLTSVTNLSIDQLTRERLTGPIGMGDSYWRERPEGQNILDANDVGFVTTPRDLARFGLLMLEGGTWGDVEVVPRAWVEDTFEPSQSNNPAYGLLWWLNGSDAHVGIRTPGDPQEGQLIPGAPADLAIAMGQGQRRLYLAPAADLIVVRFGAPTDPAFDRALWSHLSAALPTAPG